MKIIKEVMAVVLIGPMGSGKTTIGKELARDLGWHFYDADDYHPEENKRKMSQGIPLEDSDRQPWLELLHDLIVHNIAGKKRMILACSALKEKYRKTLGVDQRKVVSVFLKGDQKLLQKRIALRSHEFMAEDLLQSQLAALEVPSDGLTVDISGTPENIRNEIVRILSGLQ